MISKELLSGSTRGRPIKVVPTSSPGTVIHSTGASATIKDEVWLWATNTDTVDRKLTIEFGGTTGPDDHIEITIPAESGPIRVIPGLPLVGTGVVSSTVYAFAAAANVITITGFVNRIT